MSPDSALTFPSGTPCWLDLASTDLTASREFFGALFGWEFDVNPDPATGNYTFALAGGDPVAGLYTAADPSARAAWTLYLAVKDTRIAVERIGQLGGRATLGPVDIPGQGSMVVGQDAEGVPIGFWQPEPTWRFRSGQPGSLVWAELNTRDADGADHFFATLFSYDQAQLGDGNVYDYSSWALAGQPVLGRLRIDSAYGLAEPQWVVFFCVDPVIGADALTEHAVALGGEVVVPPADSEYGRSAVLRGPEGALFTVIDISRRQVEDTAAADDPDDD